MSWRNDLKKYVRPSDLTDIYEFGVYTGTSMIDIGNVFADQGIPIRKFFGLDSFQGLPHGMEDGDQTDWTEGNYSTQEHFDGYDIEEAMKLVEHHIRDRCRLNTLIQMIPGFYENSLTPEAILKYDMQPALYVDIDVDLYSSTITAVSFMIESSLIVPGTIIGYDDWGGTMGWRLALNGESKAHKELCEKYNMKCEELFQRGNKYPHVQKAFIVTDIG
jgi:hypothetical protein